MSLRCLSGGTDPSALSRGLEQGEIGVEVAIVAWARAHGPGACRDGFASWAACRESAVAGDGRWSNDSPCRAKKRRYGAVCLCYRVCLMVIARPVIRSIRFSAKEFDHLKKVARNRQTTLSGLVREALVNTGMLDPSEQEAIAQ